MANAIAAIEAGGGGGYVPTDEELTYSSTTVFSSGKNAWVLKNYGDRVKFTSSSSSDSNLFGSFPYNTFDVNPTFESTCVYIPLNQVLGSSNVLGKSLKEVTGSIRTPNPSNSGINGYFMVNNTTGMFVYCNYLRTINDNFIDTDKVKIQNSTSSSYAGRYNMIFGECNSLREIPRFAYGLLNQGYDGTPLKTYGTSYAYQRLFYNCYALNKIEDLWVIESMYNGNNLTSNIFSQAFDNCHNVSKFTFKTNEDGTPKTAKWTNQTIDLTQFFGYAMNSMNMREWNSGLTIDGNVNKDGTAPTFQAYKTETINDYYATNGGCSKYGHDEAVETINSLPDTSAAGGGNTIKFNGNQGYYTNYLRGRCGDSPMVVGTINKLTEAEIAVATAKGWTVTLS